MRLPGIHVLASVVIVAGAAASSCADRKREPPPAAETAAVDSRTSLDDALARASSGQYEPSIAAFERIQGRDPRAITALDGLKFVVVYAEAGKLDKHLALTRWLVERYRTPTTSTDAERSVKGYVVHRSATDPELLAHAVEVTRFASDKARADGEEANQGFFDTSRGVAEYRAGHFREASTWLAKTIGHQSLYVRSLALPVYAMSELARGNRQRADDLYKKARQTAAELSEPGSDTYAIEWTDTLISRMVLREMEDVFAKKTH